MNMIYTAAMRDRLRLSHDDKPRHMHRRPILFAISASIGGATSTIAARSFALDGLVYVAHEQRAGAEADGSQHQQKSVADEGVVAKKEGRLHEAAHVGAREVVIEAVAEYEQAGGAAAQEGAPPPAGT